MSRWPAPSWHTRVFLRTIGPHPGPKIINTWWKSYSGPAARWPPAAPYAHSGTRGEDQRASKHTRAGELRTRTNGMALHLWLEWLNTSVTPVLTCDATNNLVAHRKDGVLSLPKEQAPAHITQRVQLPENVVLVWLPAYSPALHPVE